MNFTLEPNELSDVTDDEFEMYKGLLIDPSGGDEGLKKQEIPEARLKIPHNPLPNSLDWREYGRFVYLSIFEQFVQRSVKRSIPVLTFLLRTDQDRTVMQLTPCRTDNHGLYLVQKLN